MILKFSNVLTFCEQRTFQTLMVPDAQADLSLSDI